MRQFLRRLTLAATHLYILFIGGWFLFWLTVGDRFWWSFLVNALAPWFFLVGLGPAALVALAAGGRRTRLGVLAVAGAAAWLWGALFLPHGTTAAAAPPHPALRILTLNTLTSNVALDALVATLATADADVVALQELAPGQAEAITTAFGARYPYRALLPWGDPRGIGVWSRYPLEEVTTFDDVPWENWGQHLVLAVGERRIHFLNIHIWPPGRPPGPTEEVARRRDRQIDFLTSYLRRIPDSEPFVVVGDFNTTPQNEGYHLLAAVARDSWADAGWGFGFTWPDYSRHHLPPIFRIDYIWYSTTLRAIHAERLPAGSGSDHYGLIADLIIGGGGR